MPAISVIVTAYNRKEFLDTAIKSLEKQTYKNFETIVISNFEFDISEYRIKINNIVMDGNIGDFLYAGIQNSSGNIIAFMDDDDYFALTKLECINKIFSTKNIKYCHNGAVYMDEASYTLFRKSRKIDFNMSSINIERSIVIPFIGDIHNISAAPDTFFYLVALNSQGNILNCRKILTYYRSHQKNTSGYDKISWLQLYRENLLFFKKLFPDKKSQSYIKKLLTLSKFGIYAINRSPQIKFTELIEFFIVAARFKELKLIIRVINRFVSG